MIVLHDRKKFFICVRRENKKMDKMNENNKVTVMGEIVGEFSFSHEIYGEGFYMVDILVPRLSESADQIPLMVSERLLDVKKDYRGMKVRVSGQFRSYNRHEEKKNKLVLSVFVRDWEFIDEVERSEMTNHIELDGFICKEPVYRKTPLGREIADILLAVNRPYGKSDYIAFINKNFTYLTKTSKLASKVEKKIYGMKTVTRNPKKEYIPYQRFGRKDKIVLVPIEDIIKLSDICLNNN